MHNPYLGKSLVKKKKKKLCNTSATRILQFPLKLGKNIGRVECLREKYRSGCRNIIIELGDLVSVPERPGKPGQQKKYRTMFLVHSLWLSCNFMTKK